MDEMVFLPDAERAVLLCVSTVEVWPLGRSLMIVVQRVVTGIFCSS